MLRPEEKGTTGEWHNSEHVGEEMQIDLHGYRPREIIASTFQFKLLTCRLQKEAPGF
jgi:hypothetical protein